MIAVISDSHIGRKAGEIPEKYLEIVSEADLTVHCGDFETRAVYDRLNKLSNDFIAVMGNCDRFELENYRSFDHGGIAFGVTHGKGINPRGDRDTLANIATQLDVDVLFNGHTHKQEAVEHNGKLLLNPGSCTGAPGGSYSGGNPEMMIVRTESPGVLSVELLELVNGEVSTDTKEFQL